MKFRSIAVEGPIGVGKTSFVELLVKKFEAHKVLERVENPFLRDFYLDKTGAAFQAQLFFLLSRYRQLMELSQRTLFSQVTVCDYIFPKDKIFAYLNLDDSELLIYDKLYAMLEPQAPKPDLVIFLQADTPRLIERIKRRKRDYEEVVRPIARLPRKRDSGPVPAPAQPTLKMVDTVAAASAWRDDDRGRAPPVLPRQPRPLQGAQGLPLRTGAAEDGDRQDPEVHPARRTR